MQQDKEKILIFNTAVGDIIKELLNNSNKSISKFAREYDIDRGNLSKFLRGINSCRLVTVWKIAEALDIDFVEFADMLKKRLGKDFSFYDE